jgi:two-component system CheB/CheR fusion protein
MNHELTSGAGIATGMDKPDAASDPLGLGRPTRVLVVDDEPDSLDMFELLLGSFGWQVTVAASFQEALERFDAEATDLVLSDISLPEMDGYSLIAALRERASSRLIAVAVSGLGGSEDVQRSLDAGFDAHMTKPFQLSLFLDMLRQIAVRGDREKHPPIKPKPPIKPAPTKGGARRAARRRGRQEGRMRS